MANEQVFFNERDIYVSNSRISMGGTTYSTANITSVSTRKTPVKAGCAIALIALGGVGFLSVIPAFIKEPGFAVIGFLIWGVIIAAGVLWFKRLRPTFHVVLASASGESEALSSKDEALIHQVTNAINEAMVSRG